MESFLPQDRIKVIDRKIKEIKITTGLSYPENKLLEITKALNIQVLLADFEAESEEIRGFIKKGIGEEQSLILLNKREAPSERTFTLAHELGHHFLHDGDQYFRDTYKTNLEGDDAKIQREANYFAACLLMPKEKFEEILSQTPDVKIIADYFGVPEAAVISRIIWLPQN
jgi:Zn-dependent peptidase ImmA (M78 family)